jgi:hypothetical protein
VDQHGGAEAGEELEVLIEDVAARAYHVRRVDEQDLVALQLLAEVRSWRRTSAGVARLGPVAKGRRPSSAAA